jgi:hypothetical protein
MWRLGAALSSELAFELGRREQCSLGGISYLD